MMVVPSRPRSHNACNVSAINVGNSWRLLAPPVSTNHRPDEQMSSLRNNIVRHHLCAPVPHVLLRGSETLPEGCQSHVSCRRSETRLSTLLFHDFGCFALQFVLIFSSKKVAWLDFTGEKSEADDSYDGPHLLSPFPALPQPHVSPSPS